MEGSTLACQWVVRGRAGMGLGAEAAPQGNGVQLAVRLAALVRGRL